MSQENQDRIVDRTARTFTIVDNWVFEVDLTCPQKMVLIVLKRFAIQPNRIFPSHDTIAHLASLSPRCVREALKCLEKKGLLTIQSRARAGMSNLYFLEGPIVEVGKSCLPPRQEVPTPPLGVGRSCLPPRQEVPTPRQEVPTPRQEVPTKNTNKSIKEKNYIKKREFSYDEILRNQEEERRQNDAALKNRLVPLAEVLRLALQGDQNREGAPM